MISEQLGDYSHKLKCTAIHESGHAVSHVLYGHPVNVATIITKGDAAGWISHPPPINTFHHKSKKELNRIVKQMVICSYTGMAAERMFDPNAEAFHGESDVAQAEALIRDNAYPIRWCNYYGDKACDRFHERMNREAKKLVRQQWGAVVAFAKELLERKCLRGDEVRDFIAPLIRS
jgi:ATP-dependent Zn protease